MNPANKSKPSVGSGSELNATLSAKQLGKSDVAILGTDVVATGSISETRLTVSQSTTSAAPVLLIPSGFLRLDPKILELKQQLVSQSQNSNVVMAIKREHNNNNSSSNYSDSSTFTGDNDDDDDFSSDSFSSKLARTDVAVDYSLSSSGVGSSLSTLSARKSNGPRRHTGPRKPRAHVKLSPEEEEKRHVRRERNKHAAAKCRQKRVDLTNTLLAETEKLESEQAKLQADIKAFQHEKDELEFILEAHRLHCGIAKSSGNMVATTMDSGCAFKLELPDTENSRIPVSVATTTVDKVVGAIANTNRRPNTLATRLPIDLVSSSSSGAGQIAGIAITTPSSGLNVFTLGLESMMDGHTGLTPITGLPVSYAGLSTPLMIAGISGNQLFLTGNQSQQIGVSDMVSTPCKNDNSPSELL